VSGVAPDATLTVPSPLVGEGFDLSSAERLGRGVTLPLPLPSREGNYALTQLMLSINPFLA